MINEVQTGKLISIPLLCDHQPLSKNLFLIWRETLSEANPIQQFQEILFTYSGL